MTLGRDPFHDGERYVQETVGARDTALRNGAMLGSLIPAGAVAFLAQQRMVAVGSVDGEGTVSASLLFGTRGFVSGDDRRAVVLDRTRLEADGDDVVWRNLHAGAEVGMLAIDLGSRRRLRMNGVVSLSDARRLEVRLREAYPNCPKYVQRRHLRDAAGAPAEPQDPAEGDSLDDGRAQLVGRADTLFVASHHPTRGLDVSHRGGQPGFVRVVDPRRLRVPDYAGNSMFNTLGNFMVDDRAGLVFIDFVRGRVLQMTGTVTVHFAAAEDPRQPTGGTGRYWDFHVAWWRDADVPAGVTWEFLDASPYNPSTPG